MNLNQTLLGMFMIFILSGYFIPFSGDASIKQLAGEFLFAPLYADQSWTHKINDSTNPDNFILVSTESDDNDDTEFICNKLLETCDLPNQTSTPGTGVDKKESDEISEKYFEQDGTTEKYFEQDRSNTTNPLTPPPTIPLTPPPTALNLSEPVLTATNETGSPQDNLQLYENPTLGVKILYPMEWNQIENQTNRYSVLTFLSPQADNAGTVQEKFLIRINNEPTDMSLDDYTKNVNESIQSNSNFKVISSNSTVLGNNSASSVTGTLKEGDKDLQVLDEWTVKDGIVYRIVFYSDPGKADSFEPVVPKILESFSITK